MNGGYYLADCTGLNLASDSVQTITGIWKKAVDGMKTGKPIIAHGCVYGTAAVSPVTTFGWYIAENEIVIVGATLHCHIKDDDTVTVLDVAAS
jgi:hypothetical protein